MEAMFDSTAYGERVAAILAGAEAGARRMPLAPRAPLESEGLALLRRTPVEALFDRPVASAEFADCVRSALYLYFSALDESHRLSQDIPSATGSWLHGVMHRQEPDYGNAKYWFRRVGAHELSPALAQNAQALRLATDEARAVFQPATRWNALGFVDLCERGARTGGALAADLEAVQLLEWQMLFDYCYRRALAG
jgi:hypothetical protein